MEGTCLFERTVDMLKQTSPRELDLIWRILRGMLGEKGAGE